VSFPLLIFFSVSLLLFADALRDLLLAMGLSS
jgi:hypothetical protein